MALVVTIRLESYYHQVQTHHSSEKSSPMADRGTGALWCVNLGKENQGCISATLCGCLEGATLVLRIWGHLSEKQLS